MRAHALSKDGALAAWAVGSAVIVGTSWRGASALGTFFIASSALTRVVPPDHHDSNDRNGRNARQVLANGGAAAIAALAALSVHHHRGFVALAGSLSAATADTLATEIGSTSPTPPKLLISRRPTSAGISGGVTTRGLLATVAGAALTSTVTLVASDHARGRSAIAVALAGIGGSLLDSALGELIQERRICPTCRKLTEARVHTCGVATVLAGGIPGIDNDFVNLATTTAGGALAWFLVGTKT